MSRKVLLYGATGFSGTIVAEAVQRSGQKVEWLLAGRDAGRLAELGRRLGMDTRAFSLDDPQRIDAALSEPGVFAVVNAAGPFAWTGLALAKAALRSRCHYVDLNGEADVYKQLDDFAFIAKRRKVVFVSGAAHSATTSDIMLERALRTLVARGKRRIGNIRIAFSHVGFVSQGSAQTAWRSIREQVTVMRRPLDQAGAQSSMVASHVATGRLERTFDFGGEVGARIASAASLLDLYTARLTVQRFLPPDRSNALERVERIEGYIEMPQGARIFTQVNSLAATALAFPAVRRLAQAQIAMLPEGPSEAERADDRHTVLLQIDDGAGETLIDWRMETPNPYDFTADCVLGVVDGLDEDLAGWRTPAELFRFRSAAWPQPLEALIDSTSDPATRRRKCAFSERLRP